MHNNHSPADHDLMPAKPYAMLGAGPLVSTLWKDGTEAAGWRYRFNLFRLSKNGCVGQKFSPADLKHFVKLVQVLAASLVDDGCISFAERCELAELAMRLDEVTRPDDSVLC